MTTPLCLRTLVFCCLTIGWFVFLPGSPLQGQTTSQPTTNPLRATAQTSDNGTATGSTAATEEAPNGEAGAAASDDEQDGDGSEDDESAPAQHLSAAELEAQEARVGTLNLSEGEKQDAKEYYQQAIQTTAELEALQQKAAAMESQYEPTTDEEDPDGYERYTREWYEKRLSLPIEDELNLDLAESDLENDPTEALEERTEGLERGRERWNRRVQELEAAPAERTQFMSTLPSKRQAIEQQLQETTSRLQAIDEEGINNEVIRAERAMLIQRQARLQAELAALEAERNLRTRRETVHDLELELAKRKAARYAEELEAIRATLSERRKQAADEQLETARREADEHRQLIERNPDSLGELSKYNQAVTEQLTNVVAHLDRVEAEEKLVVEEHNALSATFADFETQFGDESRLSQAGGQLLREQRSALPQPARLRSELVEHQDERNDLNFRLFQLNQKLAKLRDLDAEVQNVLDGVRPEDRPQAEPVVRSLLENQREYLESYITNLEKLEAELTKLVSAKEQLLTTTDAFVDFIAERDLWIRSCGPLWAAEVELFGEQGGWRPFYLAPAIGALYWSLQPGNWMQLGSDLLESVRQQPLLAALLVLTFGVLLLAQRDARRQIRLLGEEASKKTCTDYWPTLRVLWLTVAVSLPWPLLLWGLGWLLDNQHIESEFSLAASHGLRIAAWVLVLSELLRQICRHNGLADAHLGWPRTTLVQIRRHMQALPIVAAPLVFWLVGLDAQTTQPLWSASLGRCLYLLLMLYATWVLWRLLMSRSGGTYPALDRSNDNWLLKLHRAWRPLLVVLPLGLGVLASMGYYYTAQQLTDRVLSTAAMALLLVVFGGLVRRWVLLSRRRLAREQARQRRAAQAQAAAEASDTSESSLASFVEVPEEVVDLTALGEQTHKLVRMLLIVGGVVGAVMIWQHIFPALAWLDLTPLPGLSGNDPITWGKLLRSLLALGITYVAVRDLPGLLELMVLQRLPIDQGARYAIVTLARYTLVIVGVVFAATALGIDGTSISWLVAAMGVGLGFGLQEIFANFVSGIILLFERPIRVGDIITIGDKTGIVSRIRMRATTITDWDRKEYVVPNKDLVTERLLNWTLSDNMTRVTIEVGVAYGSDTDRACEILREIATDHPEVLDDPAPLITFELFGDSALTLVLRCFLPSLDKRLITVHELHTEIHKRFAAAGIEIAFPQRDLHLRSVPPGWDQRPPAEAAVSNGQQDAPTQAETT